MGNTGSNALSENFCRGVSAHKMSYIVIVPPKDDAWVILRKSDLAVLGEPRRAGARTMEYTAQAYHGPFNDKKSALEFLIKIKNNNGYIKELHGAEKLAGRFFCQKIYRLIYTDKRSWARVLYCGPYSYNPRISERDQIEIFPPEPYKKKKKKKKARSQSASEPILPPPEYHETVFECQK